MTRQITGFFIIILIIMSLLCGIIYAADYARAGSHSVRITIPEIIRLEVKTDEIVFDLSNVKDTSSFPTYYIPTDSPYVEVRILSNVEREWQLKIEGATTSGGLQIENIEWSLDGNNWHTLHEQEEVIADGSFTKGWREIKVYYRLLLNGDEYAGQYKLQVSYGLTAI